MSDNLSCGLSPLEKIGKQAVSLTLSKSDTFVK